MIAEIKEKGEMKRRITIKADVYIDEKDFVPGEYLAHLPFPVEDAQQSEVKLLDGDPDGVDTPKASQRTAYWKRDLKDWRKFGATYSLVSHIRYADPLHCAVPEKPLYPCDEPCEDDLAESGAYLRFTPYMRALTAEIIGDETSDLMKAWRIYEFITTKVTYTFMRDYFQFDNHGEYCAVNLKGDCGIQTLMFVTLCRICGIPARWQASLYTPADGIGNHDWSQFYLEPFGWLFCDCSFGGSAWRAGNMERWAFYLGNLDPYRMVCNSAYQQSFYVPKQHMRIDPYDNQCGECECGARGFSDPELSNYNFDLIELKRID
jgi:hypothetical protein